MIHYATKKLNQLLRLTFFCKIRLICLNILVGITYKLFKHT